MITVTASNGVGAGATQTFTLTVREAPVFTNGAATTFTVGSFGSFQYAANGYPAPMFALKPGSSLPEGLSLSSSGVLSGTPANNTGGVSNFTVTATNSVGSADQIFTLTVNEAPEFTSQNSLAAMAGTPVSFQFECSGYPKGFDFSVIAGTLPGDLSLSTGGLLSGTIATSARGIFQVTIQATNGVDPAGTQVFTITVTAPAVPDAPTGVVAVAGEGQASLSWTAPARDNGSAIVDYAVQFSKNGGQSWSNFVHAPSTETSITVTGLTNGTAYLFRVAAVNGVGVGDYSAASNSVMPIGKPEAPTNVTGTRGDGQVGLAWAAPASNGGAAITNYVVEYSSNYDAVTPTWTTFSHATSTATTIAVTGLANGTSYKFRVAAVNAIGTGVYSVASAAVTPAGAPGTPTGLTATRGDASVALVWTAPAANGSAISDYTVQYSSNDGTSWTTFSHAVSAATSITVTGLANGTAYLFRVAAVNGVGRGDYAATSQTVTPAALPGAPYNLSGTSGDALVALTWTAPSGNGATITGYLVRYSTDSGSTWSDPQATGSTSAACTVTGLTNGTAYLFQVAAVNAVGTSAYSASSSAITPAGAPGAPTSVNGTSGDTHVALTWAAPTSNGGATVTRYEVRYKASGDAEFGNPVSTGSAGTSYTVTGLTNGTPYVFEVRAVNSAGNGAWSVSSGVVTPAGFAAAPTGLGATAGNAQVALAWAAPASNGGAAISDYAVQYSSDNGTSWTTFAHAASAATSITVTGLTNGTAYIFQVAAVNSAGTGKYSQASSPVVPVAPVVAPDAPTGVTGTRGDTSVALSWTAPASNGGAAITSYRVIYSSNNGSTWSSAISTGSAGTTFTVTGLTNGAAYIFQVAAVNSAGAGAYSVSSAAAVTPAGTAGSPTSVAGTSGNAQVVLSWTIPASDNGSAITGYMVQYSSNNGSTWSAGAASGSTSNTYTVTGLANGTAYVFRVAALNGVGTGSYSAASAAVTPAAPPGAPTGVAGTAGNAQVALSWTAPASNGGAAITGYVVRHSSDNGSTWSAGTATGSTGVSYTVTGLSNGTAYLFQVRAVNSAGDGAWSANSSAVTPVAPVVAPGAATGVTGTRGNTSVALSWTAPASNGGAAITSYRVIYSSNNGSTWSSAISTGSAGTTFTVTGLTNGAAYIFQVAAVNSAGAGAYSTSSAAVTPAGAPGAPTGVAGTAGNAQVALSWTAPASSNGSAITGYVVQYSSNNGSTWSANIATGSATTSYTVTGLTNATAYRFRVAAVNAVTTGAYSAISAAVTPVGQPAAPTGLAAVAGQSLANLSWTAPSSNGGSAVTRYEYRYTTDNGVNWSTATTTGSTATSFAVTGLTPGTSYKFQVRAVNSAGAGDWSTTSSAVVPTAAPPSAVSNLSAQGSAQAGAGRINLAWTAPANGGSNITNYVIQYSTNGGRTWRTVTISATNSTSSYTLTGLTRGTYAVRIAAKNAIGTAAYSNIVTGISV